MDGDVDLAQQLATPVDMSPEAIAARLRRVVELNRLCRSLALAEPAGKADARDGEAGRPREDVTAR